MLRTTRQDKLTKWTSLGFFCAREGNKDSSPLSGAVVPRKGGIMRAFLAYRDRNGRAARRLQQAREWVDGHSSTKMVYWEVSSSGPVVVVKSMARPCEETSSSNKIIRVFNSADLPFVCTSRLFKIRSTCYGQAFRIKSLSLGF